MEEKLLTEQILKEIRDRTGEAMAAVEILAPLVKRAGSEKDWEYLESMTKSFYRILRLIRHVETYDTAYSISETETLDLAGLYVKLGRTVEDFARRLDTAFECVPPSDGSVPSYGDGYLMEMALLNLLTNAFEAAGPKGKVTMRGKLEEGRWVVTVEDDGPGLPDREAEKDPFLKTPGGVGLGLELVWRAAGLHGGTMVLETAVTGGVQAVLSIPVRTPKGAGVHEPVDKWGGFFPALVEFSPLLPEEEFPAEDTK